MLLSFRAIIALTGATIFATTVAASALPSSGGLRPQSVARDFGRADPAQTLSVTVHLKLPDRGSFNRTVDALYDPHSPTFHRWLSDAQLRQFGPSPAAVNAVRAELERNGLSVVSVAKDGFSVRARGNIASVERTFHTPIEQFSLNGKSFVANTRPPVLSGAAGADVSFVSGLRSHVVKPALARAVDEKTKAAPAAVPLSRVLASGGLSTLITDKVLGPKQTFTYSNGGKLPTQTFTGLVYDPDATRFPDYAPKELEAAYGLRSAYKQGLDGTGQTIVLLEGYGYPTALADANAFSKLTGLPPLNSSNFNIVYPEGVPNPQAGVLTGWDVEIALDISVAHAIAPGAKILVVATNGQDSQDFEASIQYIIDNHLGYAVSDSWEEDLDLLSGPAEQEGFEDVLVAAAAQGISFQFSSGDGGDSGLGTPIGAAGVPSNAPHATAVGGTSIVNVPGKSSRVSLGWGDDFDYFYLGAPVDPPTQVEFFGGGAGGGTSVFWPKPAWQQALPGFYRQTPDVSALADPYTGVPIVLTASNQQVVSIGWGGTSLASPLFTAIWAIAQQRAGHPLGQAAPTVAALSSGVTDVVPLTSDDFSATVTDATGTVKYSASQLFAPLGFAQHTFLPVLWNLPQYSEAAVIAFGANSSLTVTRGWDNVTGYGTPKGLDFINAAASWPN